MSLKSLFIDQSDSLTSVSAKTSVVAGGALWGFSDLDGAQVAGWVAAVYGLFQLYCLMPKVFARIRDDIRKVRNWFR